MGVASFHLSCDLITPFDLSCRSPCFNDAISRPSLIFEALRSGGRGRGRRKSLYNPRQEVVLYLYFFFLLFIFLFFSFLPVKSLWREFVLEITLSFFFFFFFFFCLCICVLESVERKGKERKGKGRKEGRDEIKIAEIV